MIYGYIRVSSDKQTVENQRFEIMNVRSSRLMIGLKKQSVGQRTMTRDNWASY